MRLKASAWFLLALIVMSVGMFVTASGFNPRAKLMPQILSVVLFVLALLLFISENVPASQRYLGFMSQKGYFNDNSTNKEMTGESEPDSSAGDNRKIIRIFLWLIGFIAVMKFVSYLITIPLWLMLFIRFEGGSTWRSAITVAIGAAIFVYLMFAVLLQSSL
jgi:hypothetical protein